jgi:hypothetical protein
MEDKVMSEYQRYEFMTIDQPLTREQLNEVKNLSSHIEASSTHALIEYNWGDFKHNSIDVLHKFFDGFLYWANWGAPQLAFRFPHGILPADLINHYDFDDLVTFTRHPDYDILNIHFGELQSPDEWVEYELGSLIAIRDELLKGDLRALYISWLASQRMIYGEDEEEYKKEYGEEGDEEEEEYGEEEEETKGVPPVPPLFGKLTAAQQALAELLQIPQELLTAAARHSEGKTSSTKDDFAAWVELLPQNRRNDYLVRLAHNEPGLSYLLVKELRKLGQGKVSSTPAAGEQIIYFTLLKESKAIEAKLERERREQEQLALERHRQTVHDQQDSYWQQVNQAAERKNSAGYDEATKLLVELRGAAEQFKEMQEFQVRFQNWVRPHMRRPALLQRLQDHKFTLPET